MAELKHILFIVKKAAQFDVPLFQYIHQLNDAVKFTVLYIESPLKNTNDKELNKDSKWGIDLVNNYTWNCLEQSSVESISLYIKSKSPDVVITNGYQNVYAPYVKAAMALKLPLLLRIDSVLFGKSPLSKLVRKFTMKFAYRSFKSFMTTGKKGYEYLDFIGIKKKQQSWFPYCVNNEFFKRSLPTNEWIEQHNIKADIPTILCVCKFIDRENPLELLEAFIQLNRTDIQLLMVGDGHLMEVIQTTIAKHPRLNIVLLGYVNYNQLPFVYRLSNIFVHPALDEPWGVSVQEAIASGCAVVASSRVGSAYDLIDEGKNGYIYQVGDVLALAASINNALNFKKEDVLKTNHQKLITWNYGNVWNDIKDTCNKVIA